MNEDKYPHWKDALFGDHEGMVANLRCAVKYLFWHGAYLLLAVFGVLLYAVSKVLGAIGQSGAATRTSNTLHSPQAKKAGRIGWLILLGLMVVYVIGLIVHLLLTQPFVLIGGVAVAIGLLVGAAILAFAWEKGGPKVKALLSRAGSPVKKGASKAGKKAVQTPGVRRVYGNCPVHMDLEPKWFEKIFDD